jgi:hypothetical protein
MHSPFVRLEAVERDLWYTVVMSGTILLGCTMSIIMLTRLVMLSVRKHADPWRNSPISIITHTWEGREEAGPWNRF